MWFKFEIFGERQGHDEEYFWFDQEPDANELKEHVREWAATTFTASECMMTRTSCVQTELPEEKRVELIKQTRSKKRYAEHMLTVLTGKPSRPLHTFECLDYAAYTRRNFCIGPCGRLRDGAITEDEYDAEVAGKSRFDTTEEALRARIAELEAELAKR